MTVRRLALILTCLLLLGAVGCSGQGGTQQQSPTTTGSGPPLPAGGPGAAPGAPLAAPSGQAPPTSEIVLQALGKLLKDQPTLFTDSERRALRERVLADIDYLCQMNLAEAQLEQVLTPEQAAIVAKQQETMSWTQVSGTRNATTIEQGVMATTRQKSGVAVPRPVPLPEPAMSADEMLNALKTAKLDAAQWETVMTLMSEAGQRGTPGPDVIMMEGIWKALTPDQKKAMRQAVVDRRLQGHPIVKPVDTKLLEEVMRLAEQATGHGRPTVAATAPPKRAAIETHPLMYGSAIQTLAQSNKLVLHKDQWARLQLALAQAFELERLETALLKQLMASFTKPQADAMANAAKALPSPDQGGLDMAPAVLTLLSK